MAAKSERRKHLNFNKIGMDPFLKNILEFNRQLTTAGLQLSNLKRLKKGGYDSVLIVGMGGSGLAGELLKDVQEELGLKVPVFTWKDYGLPEPETFGAKKPLYLFVSFSGNTEETLSGFKSALKPKTYNLKPHSIAAVAHGGELARLAKRAGAPLVLFPAADPVRSPTFGPANVGRNRGFLTSNGTDLNPRQYTGRMFYALIQVLRAARLISSEPQTYIRLQPASFKKEGAYLAKRLKGRVVLLYTDRRSHGLGYVWKAKLNETAKQLAFLNAVPEMNHNELTGLVFPKTKLAALFISDTSAPAAGAGRTRKRIRINLKLLKKKGVQAEEVPLQGKSRMEKMWNSIMLADWTAYELAKMNGADPAEIKIVEELKSSMKK